MEMNNKVYKSVNNFCDYLDISNNTEIYEKKKGKRNGYWDLVVNEGSVDLEDIQRSSSKNQMNVGRCTARTASHNKLVERLRKKLANKK